MRRSFCFLGLLLAWGCATQQRPAPAAAYHRPQEDAFAPALAFDPPVIADEAPLALDREPREPWAFVGYEDATTTYSYLRVDDRAASDHQGRYDRRAISERFGTTT